MSTTSEALNKNTETTVVKREGQERKPMKSPASLSEIENGFFNMLFTPTFGSAYYYAFLNVFSIIFEWKNLPDTNNLNSINLERKLNQSGRIKFIKVGTTYLVVNITPQNWNHYGEVVESMIIEPWLPKLNGKKTETFKSAEIRNNTEGHSLARKIYPFINDIDDTFENLNTHTKVLVGKFLYVGKGADISDKDNPSISDSLNQYMIDGKPFKYIQSSIIDTGGVNEVITLKTEDSTKSFIEALKFNISNMLKVLGIPANANEDKKERLITDEVNIQNVLQSSIIDNMLSMRQLAVKEINEVFGLNVSVDIKDEFKEIIAQTKKDKEIVEADNE